MRFESGQTILHYRLAEKIGQGGMGEVWRATDTRLDRDVALKFLPETVTQDRDRLDRFTREAKTLASLSHPAIAAIHDIAEHDRTRFLVMELVPGEDLSEVLEGGPLPPAEALDVALQIAQAVEVAHAHGVIHRDLKPANVKRTPDGRVKVLDFGLAKVLGPDVSSGGADVGLSPTITSAGTAAGVILGTAAYMSPEQARGRPVDRRTDVWSFGVLLYELLTGDNPFRGETVADSVGAILHREPDLDALPAGTPVAVRRLLRRCLARKRTHRLHDIADARIEIEEAIADPMADAPTGTAAAAAPAAGTPARRAWIALAALLPAVAAAAWWIGSRPAPQPPDPVRRFELIPDLEIDHALLSPDGSRLAYLADGRVWVRSLDTLDARELTGLGDDPVLDLFWSPDGRSLGLYRGDGILQRVALDGGAPVSLATLDMGVQSPVWADDGFIYFLRFEAGVSRLPDSGGAPENLFTPHEDALDYHGMDVLPGGAGILTVPHLQDDEYRRIYLERPDREPEILFESDALIGGPRYSPSGHILFHRVENPSGLWALPFSLESLTVEGDPLLVVPDLDGASVSSRGDLLYTKAALQRGKQKQQIVWADRTGTVVRRLDKPLYGATQPSTSPDGSRLAIVASGVGRPSTGKPNLWVIDLARESATRLTDDGVVASVPIWSEDGTRIAVLREFGSGSDGTNTLFAVAADGTGEPDPVLQADITFLCSLTRDWSKAACMTGKVSGENGVAIALDVPGDPAARTTLVDSPEHDVFPAIHPDGNWLAYSSGTFVELSTFVQSFPDGGARTKVSIAGGDGAFWSADGTRLYYRNHDEASSKTRVLEVTFDGSGPRPVLGRPEQLFEVDAANGWIGIDADDRFLYVAPVEAPEDDARADTTGIVLVENWASRFAD